MINDPCHASSPCRAYLVRYVAGERVHALAGVGER
jgi:hypothetical protein